MNETNTNKPKLRGLPSPRDAMPEPPEGRFDDAPKPTTETPTFADPFRGLPALAAVATFGVARLEELAARPVVYAWLHFVTAGTIWGISAGPGCGKTTLGFFYVVARVSREPRKVLNREVTPAPEDQYVVIIEAEHSAESAARKLLRSADLMGVPRERLGRVIPVARKGVHLGDPVWDEIVKLIAAGLVSDIIIDTIARVAPADANDERAQAAIFETIASAIEAAPTGRQPTAGILFHNRKPNGNAPGLNDVSGSIQRTGQVDSMIILDANRSDGRVLSVTATAEKIRDEPEDPNDYPPPCEIVVDKDRVTFGAGASFDVDDRPLEERVLERLALGPRTKSGLADELRRSRTDVDAALSVLFEARRILSATVKVRGKPERGFQLREGQ